MNTVYYPVTVMLVCVQEKLSAELDRLNHELFLMQEQQPYQMRPMYVVCYSVYF